MEMLTCNLHLLINMQFVSRSSSYTKQQTGVRSKWACLFSPKQADNPKNCHPPHFAKGSENMIVFRKFQCIYMVDTFHRASLPQLPLWTHAPGNNLGQTGDEERKPDEPKLFLSVSVSLSLGPFFLALTDLFFIFNWL